MRKNYSILLRSATQSAYAKIILTQLGGPDGEMGATTRYLNQRYTMPYATGKAILNSICD